MCENISRDVLRFESICALLKAERINIYDKEKVYHSLSETVMAKANKECYDRMMNFNLITGNSLTAP
ncbi:hypothetical protein ST9NA_02 [Salmonella phage 9NA]|uniref:Uncharacterized protein n=1 Tax=Salmonella phage 9NA TaxID=1113547 RepID=A0A060DAI2_9CAUD|nr:hypothetical protein ST9NA_02 [Salmonella phage 9NA]AIB07005.1 hypothetical protein 9NA_02 [Salmonella phage 9NA]